MRLAAKRPAGPKPGGARTFSVSPSVTLREFLPPARSIAATPPSPIRLALIIGICALFACALGWACIGHFDIYAVARGRIQPIGRSKVVQPVDEGRVVSVRVKEGDHVGAGALLVELDATTARATQTTLSLHLADVDAEIARVMVEMDAASQGSETMPRLRLPHATSSAVAMREQAVLEANFGGLLANVRLLRARADQSRAQSLAIKKNLVAQEQVRRTLDERVDINNVLLKQGWNTKSRVIDAREDRDRQIGTIVSEEGSALEAEASSATAAEAVLQARAEFLSNDAKVLNQLQQDREKTAQDLLGATAKLEHTKIYAPNAGTVQQLAITTVGQVVGSGQQLMTIVPNGRHLEIEALVENQDIGFVREGQPVTIKIDTFPFTRYGTIEGRVARVSRDAVTSTEAVGAEDTETKPVEAQSGAATATPKTGQLVYPVHVDLGRSTMNVDGRDIDLSAGENVTVEIKTGRRRLIDYILSPLMENATAVGHER
ncbi:MULTISPECIES: HlyD family type I secretion periplasmic adaptor subunit [unclassified Sphingomonas]|uniref:HlyD family type I secretion periplasmic adaptor subunit n=1 Tax=unclassified Sphingomonas TaxID=196159 RepID=UPI0006FA3AE1|nr:MULTISPECIES: HlyD family type I secretion periplasmic adaptor subunit [unclassified Sphingomonas]KQS51705.1 hypothetical protein ASG20_06950 [Sphingomonas sp. Leaf198]